MKNSSFAKAILLSSMLICSTSLAHHNSTMEHNMDSMNHMKHDANEELPAARRGDNVSIQSCWIRLLPVTSPSGGFFVIKNKDSSKPAILTGVETEDFSTVMLHQTMKKGEMMSMDMVHHVAIPPSEALEFKPGSYHAMLEKPRENLKIGDKIKMNFVLATGKKVATECLIKSASARSFDDK
jgi:copper(I)-binding protein